MSDMTAATGTPVASVRDNRGNSGTDPELGTGKRPLRSCVCW